MARVLVADDHDLVRELIVGFLKEATSNEVLSAASFTECLEAIGQSGPVDLVLLDYDMPDMNGSEGVEAVVRANGPKPVALLSGTVNRSVADEALAKGVRGILPKTLHLRSMLAAMNFILAGEIFTPFQFLANENRDKASLLTRREHDVLACICKGQSNKEIARDLDLHETTVKMHIRGLSKKLGAKNRTHAAMIAREKKIV